MKGMGGTSMDRNLIAIALLFVASAPLVLHATPQDQQAMPRDSSGEPLTAKEVRQLEKTAVTAADHRQLAAYYQFQAQQSQKKLADAEELLKKWYPVERASKVPDPYPHSIRLVNEYSAQLQKYSRLAEDHAWIAEKYDIAQRAVKNGGSTNDGSASEGSANESSNNQSSGSGRNTFTRGPKK
jgi:hypothetical protein